MFFPKATPDLRVEVNCFSRKEQEDPSFGKPTVPFDANFLVTVRNAGTASAENVSIFCDTDNSEEVRGEWKIDSPSWESVREIASLIGFNRSFPLHPSQISRATMFVAKIPARNKTNGLLGPDENVKFTFIVYAKDTEPRQFTANFSPDDIEINLGQEAEMVAKTYR